MRTRVWVVPVVAAIVVALASCGEEAPEAARQPSPTGGQVASCVVGDWRSTGVSGEVGAGPVTLTVAGARGVALDVAEDGAASLDFSRMEPMTFTGEVAGREAAGEVTYTGSARGAVDTGGEEPSGTWRPRADADWSRVRVTATVTEPRAATPIDDAPLGDVVERADELTGEVVDVDPVLGEADYACRDDTLEVTDAGVTWTFARG